MLCKVDWWTKCGKQAGLVLLACRNTLPSRDLEKLTWIPPGTGRLESAAVSAKRRLGFGKPAGTERDSVSGQQLSAVLACENVPRLPLEDQSPLPRQRRGTIVEIDRQNGS